MSNRRLLGFKHRERTMAPKLRPTPDVSTLTLQLPSFKPLILLQNKNKGPAVFYCYTEPNDYWCFRFCLLLALVDRLTYLAAVSCSTEKVMWCEWSCSYSHCIQCLSWLYKMHGNADPSTLLFHRFVFIDVNYLR